MWGSLANLKENLNKIALDVHEADGDGADDELDMFGGINRHDSDVSHRTNSYGSVHLNSNGIDTSYISEIEQNKAEIKRLRASEAEIKALSVNYAALLKEKEDHIVRLNKENSSLKQNLEATNLSVAEGYGSSKNGINIAKGSPDHSSRQQHKFTKQSKSHYAGNQINNGIDPKDAMNNGVTLNLESDATLSKMDSEHSNLQGKDKDFADLVEGKRSSAAAEQHTAEIKQLKMKLEQEYENLTNIQQQFQEEQKLKKSLQEDLKSLKMERDKSSKEMSKMRNELNEKALEIERMQIELNKQNNEEAMNAMDSLKRLIKTLEKENTALKMEKNELEAALEKSKKSSTDNMSPDASKIQNEDSGNVNEMLDLSLTFPGKEELEQALQNLSKDLKESQHAKDKALQQLTRLKQHLLEKESEESEKMDEDRKVIEELRESNNYLRAQVSHFERSLKQAIASQEEMKMTNNDEILRSREIIDDLNKKLENCMSTIDAKNIELLNLQTALGQYYAEIEAKEHLEGELARAREQSARLSQLLKDADHRAHMSRSERDEILAKLSQSEKVQSEWRRRVTKLEEENAKLRLALEQSMTQLNRMSVDSDFLVDRRIVIKLLVTYFQRNHSKEVLDLMVRMLGFSDEDKQRIGGAQQGAGKGVVRGVLGLPGRLVGGILGGSSTEAANAGSNNQSFADLWVDFLLKETEEREKREAAGSTVHSAEESHGRTPNTVSAIPPPSNQMFSPKPAPATSRNSSAGQNFMPLSHTFFHCSDNFDSEFSTVPLTSSDSKPTSETLPRN